MLRLPLPAATRIRNLRPDMPTLALWRRYEADNRRCAEMYASWPISMQNRHVVPCTECGRNTVARDGWCNRCRREAMVP